MTSKPPSPEEIQKEFEEFVKRKFGDKVQIVTQHVQSVQESGSDHDDDFHAEAYDKQKTGKIEKDILDFSYTPKQIKEHLDRYVIKQDDAKKALAIAVCDHYNYVRECLNNPSAADNEYSKQNVLILGPTGVGKTYLVKQIAKLIGVPFVKADATRFSETGYVGANVDDLVHDLVNQANGDIELARFGIVYLDEADKLASSGQFKGKDVSGRGVQFGLLKLMEETEIDLRSGNDMRSQMQAFMEFQQKGKLEPRIINTRHILFIISGAFSGLVDIIKERVAQNQIGFSTDKLKSNNEDDFLDLARTEDFIEFGFEPEFIGRLPIRVACHQLSEDDLYDILKNSAGSIIRQYERAFASYGISVTFTDDALQHIAHLAAKEKTGARGLMTVCEKLLRDYKFELPDLDIDHLVVDKEFIKNPQLRLHEIKQTHAPRKNALVMKCIEQYARQLEIKYGLNVEFSHDAISYLIAESRRQNKAAEQLCQELLTGYEYGLGLIKRNTGRQHFVITKAVLLQPQETLEKWVRQSYESSQETS